MPDTNTDLARLATMIAGDDSLKATLSASQTTCAAAVQPEIDELNAAAVKNPGAVAKFLATAPELHNNKFAANNFTTDPDMIPIGTAINSLKLDKIAACVETRNSEAPVATPGGAAGQEKHR